MGLGWIAGEVVKITPDDPDLKIPHMGWNELKIEQEHALLEGIPPGAMPISSIAFSSNRCCRMTCWPPPIMAAP